MAGEDILTYSGQAAIAYQDALNQARNTQNALLRQYGFVAPSATGAYTTEAAQQAFDPNTLFDNTTGGINQARLDAATANLRTGAGGILGQLVSQGASGEAEAMASSRASGITGGLATQRRQLAETMAGQKVAGAKSEFLTSMAQGLAPITGSWQDLQKAQVMDQLAAQQAQAVKETVGTTPTAEATAPTAPEADNKGYATKGTPGGTPPKNPKGGTLYKGPGGVSWQYRINGPSGRGWYKK